MNRSRNNQHRILEFDRYEERIVLTMNIPLPVNPNPPIVIPQIPTPMPPPLDTPGDEFSGGTSTWDDPTDWDGGTDIVDDTPGWSGGTTDF